MRLLGKMEFKLPPREENSHKGTFGKVLNISGSKYMPGAALKSGCGYVFLAMDEVVGSWQTAPIVFTHTAQIAEHLKTSQALLIGCGLGTDLRAAEIFKRTFDTQAEIPTVIDADGLRHQDFSAALKLKKFLKILSIGLEKFHSDIIALLF